VNPKYQSIVFFDKSFRFFNNYFHLFLLSDSVSKGLPDTAGRAVWQYHPQPEKSKEQIKPFALCFSHH